MNYIILAAGMGTRLHPYTKNFPKCMVQIGFGETVIQRTVRLIRDNDPGAHVVVVTGFKRTDVELGLEGCTFINNPFFGKTNSIASLWFARDYLGDDVTIINGDIVMSEKLFLFIRNTDIRASVFVDSSIKKDGDYNVQVIGERVVVMSKQLDAYYGEYAGVTKLDSHSAQLLRTEVCRMIDEGASEEWYENALVQMILNAEFLLRYTDISDFDWTEIDSVNHILVARKIQQMECSAKP